LSVFSEIVEELEEVVGHQRRGACTWRLPDVH
jgi:hypothetical protein